MSDTFHLRVTVNGRLYERDVEPRRLLVDFLRHDLGLHGTHVGCEQGVCGMCTVLLDGEPVKSCVMIAPQAQGREIRTVESLAAGDELHPVQRAFIEGHGLQCGYCTPAFMMLAVSLAEHGEHPVGDELRECLAGTLCRCTGYQQIVSSVESFLAGSSTSGDEPGPGGRGE
ncbi:MAG: (2Fe-2S)-binding protein [Acidimicrobiales bacterium]